MATDRRLHSAEWQPDRVGDVLQGLPACVQAPNLGSLLSRHFPAATFTQVPR